MSEPVDLAAVEEELRQLRVTIGELIERRRDLESQIAMEHRRVEREERDRLLARIAELEAAAAA